MHDLTNPAKCSSSFSSIQEMLGPYTYWYPWCLELQLDVFFGNLCFFLWEGERWYLIDDAGAETLEVYRCIRGRQPIWKTGFVQKAGCFKEEVVFDISGLPSRRCRAWRLFLKKRLSWGNCVGRMCARQDMWGQKKVLGIFIHRGETWQWGGEKESKKRKTRDKKTRRQSQRKQEGD